MDNKLQYISAQMCAQLNTVVNNELPRVMQLTDGVQHVRTRNLMFFFEHRTDPNNGDSWFRMPMTLGHIYRESDKTETHFFWEARFCRTHLPKGQLRKNTTLPKRAYTLWHTKYDNGVSAVFLFTGIYKMDNENKVKQAMKKMETSRWSALPDFICFVNNDTCSGPKSVFARTIPLEEQDSIRHEYGPRQPRADGAKHQRRHTSQDDEKTTSPPAKSDSQTAPSYPIDQKVLEGLRKVRDKFEHLLEKAQDVKGRKGLMKETHELTHISELRKSLTAAQKRLDKYQQTGEALRRRRLQSLASGLERSNHK